MRAAKSTFLTPFMMVVGICLVLIPLISLVYLLASSATTRNLADFGVSCDPSALLLTFLYVVLSVGLQMLLGIAAALATYFVSKRNLVLAAFIVALMVLPYAIPSVIGFSLWEFMVTDGARVQQLLFPDGSPLDGTWSRFGLMVTISVWQFFPFGFLMVLGAFLVIPKRMIDVAVSEGASYYRLAKDFLLPLAMPVIVFATLLRTVLMASKLDTPLAFAETASGDFACLASVKIYGSFGFEGSLVPMGLVLTTAVVIGLLLLISHTIQRRWQE